MAASGSSSVGPHGRVPQQDSVLASLFPCTAGALSDWLGKLGQLRTLDLSFNRLRGGLVPCSALRGMHFTRLREIC